MKRPLQLIIILFALTATLLAPGRAMAQNDPQFTQHWAVPTFYNPAYAGQIEYVRIRLGANLQWVGIKNAPQSLSRITILCGAENWKQGLFYIFLNFPT